jgi:hypothetical protein
MTATTAVVATPPQEPAQRLAHINAFPLEWRVERLMFDLLGRRREMAEARLRTAEKRADSAQRNLAAYRDSPHILNALGQRAFADGLATRTDGAREARLQVAGIRSKIATHRLPPTPQIRREWPRMSVAQRREIISVAIDCVFVRAGREDYDRRISVCPAGTGPKTLPRPGDKHTTIQSFPHAREWVRPTDRPLAIRRAQRTARPIPAWPAEA